MLKQPTIEKLDALRLHGLREAYERQCQDPASAELAFDERLALLVESEWLSRQNHALQRRLRAAGFRQQACLENLNYRTARGLKRDLINQLASGDWLRHAHNCLITGPAGIGKSYLACALGNQACRQAFRVRYYQAARLFRELLAANLDGTLTRLLRKLAKPELLIIDDWGLQVPHANQYRDFLELIDERHQQHSTLLTSQYPHSRWHELIDDPTVADALSDRLLSRAVTIALDGPSLRQDPPANPQPQEAPQPTEA